MFGMCAVTDGTEAIEGGMTRGRSQVPVARPADGSMIKRCQSDRVGETACQLEKWHGHECVDASLRIKARVCRMADEIDRVPRRSLAPGLQCAVDGWLEDEYCICS